MFSWLLSLLFGSEAPKDDTSVGRVEARVTTDVNGRKLYELRVYRGYEQRGHPSTVITYNSEAEWREAKRRFGVE